MYLAQIRIIDHLVQGVKKFGLIYGEHELVSIILDIYPQAGFHLNQLEEFAMQDLVDGGLLRDLNPEEPQLKLLSALRLLHLSVEVPSHPMIVIFDFLLVVPRFLLLV